MEDIVYNVLIRGLVIGSRHYEVLASSTSQLREHGLWMYAKDSEGRTAAYVRIWMGNFSAIKNVAKYMARMGQCLSSTEEGTQITLNAGNEIALPDIKTKDRRYIFSDGIGSVSSDLAEEIRSAYIKSAALNDDEVVFFNPTAFQIRYKGCKGMVAIDPTLPVRTIGIRPSMEKFECVTSSQLEIVKISAPRKLFLNKHLITILEQMGVPKKSFLDLQINMMMDLLDSLVDEGRAASILIDNMPVHFPFSSLSKAGIFLTREPFFRSLLLAFFKSFAAKLQTHMRIAIPESHGRNMLGILDETKTLKYGEVFVQYSKSIAFPNRDMQILRGSVIVTKNPCLHPGDVRKLTAVDVPALHHLRDCIVFPAQGKRPHPDEMAGSDLDGDEFVVLWYESLIFKRKNYEPMQYPVYTDNNLYKENIELSDMLKFFCQYIQNDTIGTFAHAHLVWADRLENGIFSKKCMSIAQRYPYVLDFAKHGTQEVLQKSDRPDQYPDFMQKGLHGHTYHSKKVLGSLYRVSRVLEACSSKVNLVARSSSFDPDLEYTGWQRFQTSAEENKLNYSKLVSEVLDRYGLVSEAEAFSGFIELNAWKKWKHETSNAVQVIKRYIISIMSNFRLKFLNEVEEESTKKHLNDHDKRIVRYQLASAWYMVVYGQNVERILSFPWIVSDILVEIKQQCENKSSTVELGTSQNFYDDIDADLKLFSSNPIEDGFKLLSIKSTCFCVTTFIKKKESSLGSCSSDCKGFLYKNLQELSLQTLSYLVVSRNIFYLGLKIETSNYTKSAISMKASESIFEDEGTPIKIPVNDVLKKLIEEYMDEIKTYLTEESGIKGIIMKPEQQNGKFVLIVNSLGKNWQRWNLQNILLDPEFTSKLKIVLNAK
ncbi:uncharacterized protein LOC129220618 [Uloborus diversus]|uniref:uncharacterized protein LOC129220618 n=1 Tax=Uloborus diversus TaxID=327109 RepID=UPI0024096421|nr:uncharacterized protein LOC129220618 [Uloborus diversus]